jgi:hypothetical protein
MNEQTSNPRPHDRVAGSYRRLAFAAVYGIVVAAVAMLTAEGDPLVALLVMVGIGTAVRIWQLGRLRRRAGIRLPWWRWL